MSMLRVQKILEQIWIRSWVFKMKTFEQFSEGSLHKWFKGSKSKDGKSGWVNVKTGGTCASDEPGEGTPKCVSSSKRASMTKAERDSASRRKKAADPNQQSKSGAAKPTYVATDKKEKVDEACWKGYKAYGMKKKGGKMVPNCKPVGSGVKEHHQKDANGKVIEHGDGTPSSVEEGKGYQPEIEHSKLGDAKKKADKKRESKLPPHLQGDALGKMKKAFSKEDYYRGTGEKVVARTKKYMDKKGMKGAPGLDAMKARTADHKAKRGVSEAKVEAGRSDYGKASVRNKRKFGKEGEPAVFDASGERGKMIDQRRADHKAKRGVKEEVVAEADKKGKGSGTKDACYHKVKASAKVWPSAYASGRLVQCRKKGAGNYGNSKKEEVEYVDEAKSAAWQRKAGKNPEGGLNQKGVDSYRAANPGSKLKTAVTTKPSKLKKGSKSANRRKSFCARMSGMKKKLTSAKTANDPDSRINKSLRKWNCSYEPDGTPIMEEDKALNFVLDKIRKEVGKDGYVSKNNPRKPATPQQKAKVRAHQAKVDAENAAERKKDPSQGRYPKG